MLVDQTKCHVFKWLKLLQNLEDTVHLESNLCPHHRARIKRKRKKKKLNGVRKYSRQSCHLIKCFEGINGVSKIKDGYNPATWMLEVTTMAQEEILGTNFAETYKNSDLFRRNKALINELSAPPPGFTFYNLRWLKISKALQTIFMKNLEG